MFNHLDLEEIESDAEDLSAGVRAQPHTTTAQSPPQERYEVQDDGGDQSDATLRILGFFQDLHRIEEFVCNTWRDYRAGKCSLCTAALITNAALCLVEEMEENLVTALGLEKDFSHHYLLKSLLSGSPCPGQGHGSQRYPQDAS